MMVYTIDSTIAIGGEVKGRREDCESVQEATARFEECISASFEELNAPYMRPIGARAEYFLSVFDKQLCVTNQMRCVTLKRPINSPEAEIWENGKRIFKPIGAREKDATKKA